MIQGRLDRNPSVSAKDNTVIQWLEISSDKGSVIGVPITVAWPDGDFLYWQSDKAIAKEVIAELATMDYRVKIDPSTAEMELLTREEEAILKGIFEIEEVIK